MSEVLSQSQIDMLLNSMQSGEEPPVEEKPAQQSDEEYRSYNFYSPKKFTRDKLKVINNVYENYARMLASKLNGLFRTNAEVEVMGIEEQRYYEFSNAFGDNDVLGAVSVKLMENKKATPVLMNVSTQLTLAMIDMMIGGGDGSDVVVPPQYKYTDVELSLFEALHLHIVKNFKDSWSSFTNVDFTFNKIEQNPSMMQVIGADETVVIVVLDVRLGAANGRISICLPGSTLTSIFSQYEKNLKDSQGHRTNGEEEKEILDALRDTSLEIKVKMGSSQIQLRDAYELKPGDIINLNRAKDSNVFLYIDNREQFSGKLGIHKKKIAVKINGMVGQQGAVAKEQYE